MTNPDDVLSVNGYSVLKVKLPSLPSYPQQAWHYLYLHRHEPKISTRDDDRTLFVVNVPVDATEAHFRCLFQKLASARVVNAQLSNSINRPESNPISVPPPAPNVKSNKKRKRIAVEEAEADAHHLPDTWDRQMQRSGGTALVVFETKAGLAATLKAMHGKRSRNLVWGEGTGPEIPVLGSNRYYMHHRLRYPPPVPLQASVDAYMARFAGIEAERALQAKRLRSEPDEDGFVTVTRGGRTGPARQEEAQAAAERQKKRSGEGLTNFYRFQLREERKKAQGELLRRFDDDRRKLEEMKKKRRSKFRPE